MAIISKNNGIIKGTGNPNLDVNIQDGDTITPLIYIDYSTTPPTFYKFNDNLASGSKWVLDNTVTNADSVPFTPAGSISSTDVQSAVEEVQSNVEDIIANEVLFKTTIAELRASTATHDFVYITDENQTGIFKYSSTSTEPDNTGTVLIATNGRKYIRQYEGKINAKWFGAVGDGIVNDQPALQNAINFCIKNSKYLFIPVGNYKINSPLLLLYDSYPDLNAEFFSVTIEGESKPYLNNTTITANFNDTFAIGIQRGKGVSIKNIRILGKNTINFDLKQVIETPDNLWTVNDCRDSRYSPYSGIVVDPFGTTLPVDGGYPGMSAYYSQIGSGGSTGIDLENIYVNGFVVGIMFSPSGSAFNSDVTTVTNSQISNCKAGLAFGQSQTKGCKVTNIMAWQSIRFLFNGDQYGSGNGYMPIVEGGTIAGSVRSLFRFNQNWSPFSINNFFAESIHSLGFTTGTSKTFPLSFVNCQFHFNTNYNNNIKNANCLLESSNASFFSCALIYYGYSSAPMTFYVQQGLNFTGCTTTDIIYNRFTDSEEPFANVVYINHRFSKYSATINPGFNSNYRINNLNTVNVGTFLSNGSEIVVDNTHTVKEKSSIGLKVFFLEGLNITVTSNKATFSTSYPGRYQVNDILFSTTNLPVDSGSTINTTLGKVESVIGSTVTLAQIPYSLVDGVYGVYHISLPKYHSQTFCTGVSSSNVLTNVICADPLNGAWLVGDKVFGNGIWSGTYITAIDNVNKTITLSENLNASITNSPIFGAEVFRYHYANSAPSTSGWLSGDIVYNTNPSSGILSWVCTSGGAFGTTLPPVFTPIFASKNVQSNGVTDTTDANGDIVITFPKSFSSEPTYVSLSILGTIVFTYTIVSKTATNATVRIFDMAGAPVVSTSISLIYTASQ